MQPDNPCFAFTQMGLKYFMALCIGTAALLPGLASILAQESEDITATGNHTVIVRGTSVTSPQHLSMINAEQLTPTTEVADILEDNPALFCSLTATSPIDNAAGNREADNGGEFALGLRGQGYTCVTWVMNEL